MNIAELQTILTGGPEWSLVIDKDERDGLARRLAETEAGRRAAGEVTSLAVSQPPFYRRLKLYRAIIGGTVPAGELLFLADPRHLLVLDGSARPLQEAGRLDGTPIDAGNAAAYLAFFFSATRPAGPGVRLVGTLADMPFDGRATAADRQRVAPLLKPLVVKARSPAGVMLEGTLLYGNALLSATYLVTPAGEVTSMGETLLLDDLPAEARPALW